MMMFEIIPMLAEHLPEVSEVQRRTFSKDLCETSSVFLNRFERFGQYFYVVKKGSDLIGYMVSFPWKLGDTPANNQNFPTTLPLADCFYIHDITLLPEARGTGLASAMIELACKAGRELGYKKISLVSVLQSGSYWDKNGFQEYEEVSLEKRAAIVSNYGHCSRLMLKSL